MNDVKSQALFYWIQGILTSAYCLLLISCNPSPPAADSKNASLVITKTLRVIVQSQDLSQLNDVKGTMGFQQELIEHFAMQHGYQLTVTSHKTEEGIFDALKKGHADIALVNAPVKTPFTKGPDILNVKTQLIYKRGNFRPLSFEDLDGRHVVVNDSQRSREQYTFLKSHYPNINFTFSQRTQEELLQDINNGIIDYSLVNSKTYLQMRSRYHRTKVAYDAFYPESINWLLPTTPKENLLNEVEVFFARVKKNGTFRHIKDEYFGHVNAGKRLSSITFFSRVKQRLPRYQDLIEQIAKKHNLDWRLLASIAYQESHWNPRAKSPTGVRGMMMLTQPTARDLGVKNRLDPAASLNGGAQYLISIHGRLEPEIQEPDRTWFTLAAYNVGYGHLQDAREITAFHGANPNRWVEVKKYLPLLERKEWYQFTRYGKARGKEPVKYVQYIRHFKDLLEWQFPLSAQEQELLAKRKLLTEKANGIKTDDQLPALTLKKNNS